MVAHNFCSSTGEAETDLYDLGDQHGLHGKYQDSQGCIVRLSLKISHGRMRVGLIGNSVLIFYLFLSAFCFFLKMGKWGDGKAELGSLR